MTSLEVLTDRGKIDIDQVWNIQIQVADGQRHQRRLQADNFGEEQTVSSVVSKVQD
jgi:hypothetical protein